MSKAFSSKTTSYFTLFLLLIITNFAWAQAIQFQGTVIEMPDNIDNFSWNTYPNNSQNDNGYYGWVRFENTPSQSVQDELKSGNYRLLGYYPEKVYSFYFPKNTNIQYLKNIGISSIIPIGINQKMSKAVKNFEFPDWALDQGKVLLSFTYFFNYSSQTVISELSRFNSVEILKQYKNSNLIDIAINPSDINSLTALPFLNWIDVITPPSEKDDFRGRSLHRSSNLDTGIPSGRQYTGEGIGVMVRDDGIVGPHIDFQGRIDNSSTNSNNGTHGDGVAGIMAGAGNLNPFNRGMAAGSDVYVVNYAPDFLDTPTLDKISNGEVQITNSSFSNGCNSGYTQIARTVDQQTNTFPELMHVFSAGNAGDNDCGFGAGSGWGNITGGHKMGKNVLAVANTFFNGQLANSSSRGPSTDGRIKPDITAHGQGQISTDENNSYLTFGGTSGAAPGVAGVAAQLYEAYADLNGGNLPESALIKAIMLNTATDYGNPGPDFRFGWGMVNGLRSAIAIENGNYLNSTISQSQNNTHNITIPSGTKQLKVMLYWSDVEGMPGASPALVNDIDFTITNPFGSTNQPFILDPTPIPSILDSPASTGLDRLNNMEQVVLDNPIPGSYNLNVSGFNIPVGPQKYYIVYDIIQEDLTVTYPEGGEKIVANTNEVIHWEGLNLTGNTTVQYSSDNGATWNTIGTVPASRTNITWNVPNVTSGDFLIRVSNNANTAQSASNFSVAPRVELLVFSNVCPTEATITWLPIPGSTSYDVYLLGDKFMEVVGNTPTTTYTLQIDNPTEDIWVAVSAKGSTQNDWESLRTNALLYDGAGLFNCPLEKDISVTAIQNNVSLCSSSSTQITAEITNEGTSAVSNFVMSYQINNEPVIQETFSNSMNPGDVANFTFTNLANNYQNGNNTLRVWSNLSDDEYVLNDEKTIDFITYVTGTALDFTEDFETDILPIDWQYSNPDNGFTWEALNVVSGADGNQSNTIFVDNYFYNTNGELDTFSTELFDLNFVGTPELRFDLAKAQYSNQLNDGLRVEISLDCGLSFQEVYFKDGLSLSTVPNFVQAPWTPSSSNDWRTEIIDLSPYVGNDVLFRFVNINGYGNSTLIDNINIIKNETLSISDNNPLVNSIVVYPNPTQEIVNINIDTDYGNNYSVKLNNVLGQTIWKSGVNNFSQYTTTSINMSSYNSGIYFITIQINDKKVIKKLIKK